MSEFNLKDYRLSDTIAAPATPSLKSALGVIKISGKKSIPILSRVFVPKNKKNIKKQKSFTLHYGWIINKDKSLCQGLPQTKSKNLGQGSRIKQGPEPPKGAEEGKDKSEVIDEVLVSVMRAPFSYTREDVVEVSSHGGPVVLGQILEVILKEGARLAKPGEFSWRALVNGRIDLLQAESILGLVDAKTPEVVSFSSKQLKGEVSQKLARVKDELKYLFTQTESLLNFPEEGIGLDEKKLKERVIKLKAKVNRLRKGQQKASILSQGLKCVICGRANSGKSTLFNRLLGKERVIVSRAPGTTRDVIEETINIQGMPVNIYDTAGILEPKDFVTRKALEKTNQIFEEADLVILLFDGSKKIGRDDLFFLSKIRNKKAVLVVNKSDLPQKLSFDKKIKKVYRLIKMSALKDKGLHKFEQLLGDSIHKEGIEPQDLIFLNQHQKKELENLEKALSQAEDYLKKDYQFDFVNFSLKDGLDAIGKITGEIYSEEILESIFSNFCIGK